MRCTIKCTIAVTLWIEQWMDGWWFDWLPAVQLQILHQLLLLQKVSGGNPTLSLPASSALTANHISRCGWATSSVHTSVSGTSTSQQAVNTHRLILRASVTQRQGKKKKKNGSVLNIFFCLLTEVSAIVPSNPSMQMLTNHCSKQIEKLPSCLQPPAARLTIRTEEKREMNRWTYFFLFFFWYCVIHSRHAIMSVVTSYLWTTTWPE